MIYAAAQIYLSPETVTDPVTMTYSVGCLVAFRLLFTVSVLFAQGPFPDHWRRVRDEVDATADASGLEKLPSNFPLTKKLWWMIDIAYNARMVGWIQEPRTGIPPHPPPSRRTFLWKTSLKLIMNFVIYDFASSVVALSPAFDYRLHDPTDGPETYLAAVPFFHRVPYVLAYAIVMGAVMSAEYGVVALVCVGLGHSSPTLWPDIWGRWRDAHTVRKLWGYVR